MEYKGKKYCFVPFCGANRKLNPERIFFLVPKENFMRDLWIKAAKRNASITGPNTMFYCCQNHFDLELDMENYKKYMENKGKVRPALKPNVVPHRFECLQDLPPGSDMRKRRMMNEDQEDDIHLSYFASICKGERVAQLTLDEMNSLLLDINNLGVLGDILNAYNQIYNEMAWNLDFMVENSRSWYCISVKKADDKQTVKTDECSRSAAQSSDAVRRGNKRRRVHTDTAPPIISTDNSSDVDLEYNSEDTQSALLDGGHIYTKNLSDATVHPNNGNSDDILPKHRVHTVYQCEYCYYGSLEKYCLKHHIHSRHSTRFKTPVKHKKMTRGNLEEKNLESSQEILKKPSEKKTKPLPYYLPRDKSLTELTRLSKEVKRKNKWLEDFIDSLSHKNQDIKPKLTNKTYSCSLCDFTGGDQTEVYKHIGLRHTNDTDVFSECPICGDYTDNRKALLVHLRDSHPGTNRLQCSQCPYSTESTQLFFRHVLEVHKRVKHFKCNDCSFNTARKGNLIKHIDILHKRELLPCPEEGCQFKAPNKESLTSHTMIVHEGQRPFLCSEPECDYAGGNQCALNKHMSMAHRSPKRESPNDTTNTNIITQGKINCIFVCTHCGNKFSRKQTLDKHMAKCHLGINEKFSCSFCTFTCITKRTMDIHIREIHKGYLPFKCDKCEFKTSLKNKFETHYRVVHLKQKPHNCPHCNLSFSLKACVLRHIQDVHLKEKPHLCVYCEFSTAHRTNLKSHLQSIHNIAQQHLPQALKNCVNLRRQEEEGENMRDSLLIFSTESLENLQIKHEDVGNMHDDLLEQEEALHNDSLQDEELCQNTLQDEELQHEIILDEELQGEIILDEELQDEILLEEELHDDPQEEELQGEIILDEELQDEILLEEELQDDTLQDDRLHSEIIMVGGLQDDTLQDVGLQENTLQDVELQGNALQEEEVKYNTVQENGSGLDDDNHEILHNIDLVIES